MDYCGIRFVGVIIGFVVVIVFGSIIVVGVVVVVVWVVVYEISWEVVVVEVGEVG